MTATATQDRTGHRITDIPNEAHAVERAVPRSDNGQRQEARAEQPFISREQIDLLKRTICRGATDDELQLFIQVCSRLRLDAFAKQIHAVKRRQKVDGQWRDAMSFQVGIDGFRLVAERTGKYAGQRPVEWCGKDAVWKSVWLEDAPPAAARATVLRTDFAEPLVVTAHWNEYKQTTTEGALTSMWTKMGVLMLGKVAEALALRKAFPQELSGVYAPEEMAQADHPAETGGAAESPAPAPLDVDAALKIPLIGGAKAWGGKGGTPLGELGSKHLERVRTWCAKQIEEHGDDVRMAEQLEACTLILDARAGIDPTKKETSGMPAPAAGPATPPPADDEDEMPF